MAQVSQGRERGEFIAARLWRILPLWFIALAAQLTIFPVHWSRCPTLASITMWPAWPNWCFPYVIQGWTLSYELLFYSLVALFIRRQGWLFVVLPILILWRLILPTPPFLWLGNPLTLEFLMGVALAHAPRRYGLVAIVVGLSWLSIAPVETTSLLRAFLLGHSGRVDLSRRSRL
jgi:exopolysaccharide production protein ExoZ